MKDVDGVYIIDSLSAIMSQANIERVEVLKGPQGALFGRNATGGLMHVITKDPSHETDGFLEVGIGDYETNTSAYLTGELSESLAADITVYYSDQREGYGTSRFTGNDISLTEETVVRT